MQILRTASSIIALLAFAPAALIAQESYTLRGSNVAIYNLAGTVDVVATSGSAVEVSITIGGADADRLTVETGPIDGRETLRIIYPADRIVYSRDGHRGSRSQLRVRSDGTFFGRGDRGDRVTIAGSGDGLEAHADLVIGVPAGQQIGVYLGVGGMVAENVNGTLDLRVASSPLRVRGITGDVSAQTGSGSVTVRDVDGTVKMATGSGSIDAFAIRGPSLSIATGSGGIDGGDLTVDRLDVSTGSGSIELETVTMSDGELETGSGRVRLDLVRDVGNLSISTGSGGITVAFPDDLGATLDLETGSGSIDVDMPVQVSRMRRQELRGTLGDGEGLIEIDTGSGSIRFVRRQGR